MYAIQRVSEEYLSKKAILGVDQIVEFEEDKITLDISMDGEVMEGWKVTPMFYPMVGKIMFKVNIYLLHYIIVIGRVYYLFCVVIVWHNYMYGLYNPL